ncbi:MAG: hypothetical protein CMD98_04625 [Gammaproteobacteria bacterium]|nr:hypothetical protein [Gammaproteobacteria bacterium]|tara:strand:- start:1626 stop:3410 length:1785 start_codon:yes stop_codon:yes gene_type:complete
MAGTIIQIKYSGTGGTAAPASGTLTQAELAYSFNSNKMFIGNGDSPSLSHIIGGKHFVDMLDHTAGTLTASSALIVDSSSKIDVLNVDNITIDGNTISSTNADGGITLDPNGSGTISLSAATSLVGDLTHTGTGTVSGQWNVDNLRLDGNTLNTTNTNGDLTVASNGTGRILLDGTTVVVIPKGTEAQRPTAANATDGALRYSTTNTRFEGVVNGSWVSVGGVKDTDGDTYIEPELGADDDNLRFYIAGTEKAKLNATGLQVDDALEIDGTANVDGAVTMGSTLGVTGNTTLSGTLDVTGAVNFNNTTASSSTTTGAVIIDGGVGVAEDVYAGGQIVTSGDATFGGDLAVTGDTVLSGNLTVSGTTTTVDTTVTTLTDPVMHVGQGSLAAGDANDRGVSFEYGDGSVVKDGFFGMDIQTERFVFQTDITSGNADDDEFSSPWSDAQFNSLYLDSNLSVTGTSTVTGNSTYGGTLGVTGATTLSSTLAVTGALSANGGINTASGDLTIAPAGGDTTVTGTLTVSGALSANSASLTTALPVGSGGTGLQSYTSNGYFIANTGGTAMSFITGTQYQLLQFNGSGVPVASSTIDCGTF